MNNSNIQVVSNHYSSKDYDSFERMQSYLIQIKEITAINPERLLEIGIGNGFLSDYLRRKGFNVTTCDIDERLNPDKQGSVLALSFPDNSFDLVVCFQVLEHLPFSDFKKALFEIKRVTKQLALISLPDAERCFKFSFEKNSSSYFRKYIVIPRIKKPEHKFDGEHYWEIGKNDYELERIIADIQECEWFITRTYRVFDNPYHRLFILNKSTRDKGLNESKFRIGNLENWRNEFKEESFSNFIFKRIPLCKKRKIIANLT